MNHLYERIQCLKITPKNNIEQVEILLKTDNDHLKHENENTMDFKIKRLLSIYRFMDMYYDCKFYKSKIAKTLHADNFFYYIYYQENHDCPYNKVASHLLKYIYNVDPIYNNHFHNNLQCYGDCYIIGLD